MLSHLFIVMCIAVVGGCGSSGPSAPHPHDGSADVGAISFVLPDALIACYGSAQGPTDIDGGGSDPLCAVATPAVSYAKDVAPIFAGCSGEVCHAPWQYDTTVDQHSQACCNHRWLVEPGQPSASHIVQAVTGVNACVSQMPQNEGSLSTASIATLIAWVCQGAKND